MPLASEAMADKLEPSLPCPPHPPSAFEDDYDEEGDDDDDDGANVSAQSAVNGNREAMEMLRMLLKANLGKRSAGDMLPIMVDPTLPFRLKKTHRQQYMAMLEAFDVCPLGASAAADPDGPDAGGGMTQAGFLPRAALAALFARAAYSALMRRGGGDNVAAFGAGAASSAAGRWGDVQHLDAFCELAGADREDVLLASWAERAFEPAFVVFWVSSLKWLVVCVRGSSEWGSVLTDIS